MNRFILVEPLTRKNSFVFSQPYRNADRAVQRIDEDLANLNQALSKAELDIKSNLEGLVSAQKQKESIAKVSKANHF